MNNLEKRVLDKLNTEKEPRKQRYTFFIDITVKNALSKWCKEKGQKESPTIEAMLRELIPEKYFREK